MPNFVPNFIKKSMKRLHLFIILSFITIFSSAEPYCDVRKFSILDGLAANSISDLAQGYDNLMWFGTWNGLSYYDGYHFKTFRDEPDDIDIMSTNRILSIFPSPDNNVWVVTFDRKLYIFDTDQCQFIKVGTMLCERFGIHLESSQIYPLANGHTWITTHKQNFLIRVSQGDDIESMKPELIKVGEKGLRSGNVWFIKQDKRGREWILTDKGTFIYGKNFHTSTPFKWFREVGNTIFLATTDGKVAVYDEQNHLSWIPMPAGVTRINELKNTGYQLIIATNIGLVVYNPRTFKTDVISVQSPNQPVAEVKKAYVDSHNMVWAFTEGQGVTVINPQTMTARWLYVDAPTPADRTTSNSFFIMEDERGTLWTIPNYGTFSYYDRKTGKLVPYMLRSNSAGNSYVPYISKYTISDQGILWLVGIHDLTQVNFKVHNYSMAKLDEGESEARAMAYTNNGFHWDGFKTGHLKISDSHFNKVGYLQSNGQIIQQQIPFSHSGIYAIYQDMKERMWIGTDGDGLYLYANNTMRHFRFNEADKNSLPGDSIYDVQSDRQGNIWVATYGGGLALVREDPQGNITFLTPRNGLRWPKEYYNKVRRITCTASGEILVGTTGGLVTFKEEKRPTRNIHFYTTSYRENDTTSLTASDINYILMRSNGDTYVSSMGGTLDQITSGNLLQDNLKVRYCKFINTSEGNAQSLIEDNSGNIWIVRESSIDKYNPKTNELTVFGPNDFDLNMTFSEARPIHDPSTDNITVGTMMGSLTFNPARLKQTDYQPRIIFTELHYNGSNENIPILHQKKVVIPANKRNLTISFAALDYTRKYQQYYKYRIDGHTPEGVWIDLRGQNRIGFNRISHGDYVLKVIATNTHGKWSKHVATLELDVQPTFWESIWGKLLIILIIAGIAALCFMSYNKQQKERINHEMNVMKNKFFSKASHKLRTPLTLIGGPIDEVLEKENNISDESRNLLQMVQRNAKEMLNMLNRMLKFDNGSDFYLDEGSDQAFVSSENNGSISDETAKGYLQEANKEETEEADKTEPTEKDITILVVEDNPDLRQFLFTILKTDYNVLLAENGKEGLVMARSKMPDFILTDVTMPVMDGFTMVHYIKQDTNTAHIPIIVLSAKASVEDHLRGFEEGVDGYLTKPFSATYLKGRIEAVINQRHALQQDMLKQIQRAEGAEFHITHEYPQTASGQDDSRSPAANKRMTEEDALTEKIVQFINENMSNPDLKIDDIAVAMGMSRSVLYGKIKNAVGMKPIDFVRHIRIMRATELLCNTDETLSSIAYSLGFSDPKYFSKVFKKEMGIIPSEYRENSK